MVPDEDLDAEVDAWCREILANSPQGLRLAKLALNAGSDVARASILPSVEINVLSTICTAPIPAEGIAAFQRGTPPDWRPMRAGQGPPPETI